MMRDLINTAKNRANEFRNKLGLGNEPISNIFNLLESQGIYLFRRPLKGNASAMFMKSKDAHLVIINSNKTLGHQYFSAAHELSHFLYDTHILGGICSVNKYNQDIEIEKLADYFASHLLMPEEGILKHLLKRTNDGKRHILLSDIIYLQQYFKVSWSAMLIRLLNLNLINKSQYDYYKNIKITREAARLGYSLDLYIIDSAFSNSQNYIEKVIYAFEEDEISKNKLDEFLNDIDTSLEALELNADTVLFEKEDEDA